MNTIKKILIAHHEPRLRRRLVMLFAAAGFDVRPFGSVSDALQGAQLEWFDLAVVDGDFPGTASAELTQGLRRVQPTLQQLLVVGKMELGEVVRGIRQGVAEVVAVVDDPQPVLRQALAFFRVADPDGTLATIEAGEMASLEAGLAGFAEAGQGDAAGAGLEAKVLQLIRQNDSLAARLTRLQEEKAGLETELRTLVAQATDTHRLEGDLECIRQERELAAATQEAIDEKARALAALRATIASERSALECERQRATHEAPPASRTEDELNQVRAELSDWRRRLELQDDRLASDTVRIRQESLQLARERRRWHEDLEVIRAQETNLRAYEGRLREMQSALETERVRVSGQAVPGRVLPTDANEHALREAWTKIQRTGELLEAERKNFLDDRLHLREQEKDLRRLEAKVRDREIRLALKEKAEAEVVPAPAPAGLKVARIPRSPATAFKNLTRAPFDAVRLALRPTEKA
jgi:CheY-like chemotaxis protein